MRIQTFIVDAFTDVPFKGNPAGVCLLDTPLDEKTMQSIAMELNLSETAFLLKTTAAGDHFSIRYFTPTVEIDFCGHATLAASKVVLTSLNNQAIDFTTYRGLSLSAAREGDYIKMKFPLYETVEYAADPKLYAAFGVVNPVSTRFAKDLEMLIIEVKDKETLLNITPDYLEAIESSNSIKEVVITTKSEDQDYDFYSRCFCPWIGINEDPVTGASHSVLAKYWGDRLNKNEMSAYQLSSRGGFLKLNIIGNNVLEVRSNARIVFEGELML